MVYRVLPGQNRRDYAFLKKCWKLLWCVAAVGKVKIVMRAFAFLCAFQLYSVLDDENTPEYPEEQGQFSPGVNSEESLQETLEMDCRMESPPHLSLLFALCSLRLYTFPPVTRGCLPC